MAGPQNNFNSALKEVIIFDTDGNEVKTTRPNAIDLIRTNGYRWKREDVGVERTEDEGPVDSTADVAKIYNAAGEPLEVDRANARELINTGKYTWHVQGESNPAAVTEAEAADAVIEAAAAVVAAEAAEGAESLTDEAAEGAESLTDEAVRVAGDPDVAKYLEGFSLDALKQIAGERYGEKIHHRASKETAIAKIVELEEAAQTT